VVLDVGANFGQMSVLFANRVGEGGQVFSFEADDWVYEILCKNIAANEKSAQIKPVFGAVHDVGDQILHFPSRISRDLDPTVPMDWTMSMGRGGK